MTADSAVTTTVLKDHILGLQHIGHLVPDLRAAIASFQRLYGIGDTDVQVFPAFEQAADTRFAFIRVGEQEFELIEAISPHFKALLDPSPCGGGGINHVAYRVDDVTAALASLAMQGIVPGHVTPDGVVDTGSKLMVYLDPATTDGLLIELIEVKLA